MDNKDATVKFRPHQFRSQEYEVQVEGKCIGHVWKYGTLWSVRIGDRFTTSPTFRDAKGEARKFAAK